MLITTVMYHYVRDLENSLYPKIKALKKTEFINQLEYFKSNYNFITIEDCMNKLENPRYKLPKNPILLTFDDAYSDHFYNVFPILQKNNIQGVFFPPAEAICNNKVLDVNKIHFILACIKNINILINEISNYIIDRKDAYNLKDENFYFNKLAIANDWDIKEVIYVKRMLQNELPIGLRKIIVNNLFTKYVSSDEKSFANDLYMNINQLKTMSENNMVIGGHCYSHPWLETLTPSDQEKEIDLTRDFLSIFGVDLNKWIMCYPYGSYNDETIKILREKSCSMSFSTKFSKTNLKKSNRFTLERLDTNHFPK